MIQLPASNRTVSSEYYASTASPINLVGKLSPKIQEVFRIRAANARSKTELVCNEPPPSPQSTANSPNRSFYQLIQVSPENALQREAKGQPRGDRARFLQSFITERTHPSDTHPLPSRLSPSSSEAAGPGGRAQIPADLRQLSPPNDPRSRFPPPSPRGPRRSPRRGLATLSPLGSRGGVGHTGHPHLPYREPPPLLRRRPRRCSPSRESRRRCCPRPPWCWSDPPFPPSFLPSRPRRPLERKPVAMATPRHTARGGAAAAAAAGAPANRPRSRPPPDGGGRAPPPHGGLTGCRRSPVPEGLPPATPAFSPSPLPLKPSLKAPRVVCGGRWGEGPRLGGRSGTVACNEAIGFTTRVSLPRPRRGAEPWGRDVAATGRGIGGPITSPALGKEGPSRLAADGFILWGPISQLIRPEKWQNKTCLSFESLPAGKAGGSGPAIGITGALGRLSRGQTLAWLYAGDK